MGFKAQGMAQSTVASFNMWVYPTPTVLALLKHVRTRQKTKEQRLVLSCVYTKRNPTCPQLEYRQYIFFLLIGTYTL